MLCYIKSYKQHHAFHVSLGSKPSLRSVCFHTIKKHKSPQVHWSTSVPDQRFDLLGLMERPYSSPSLQQCAFLYANLKTVYICLVSILPKTKLWDGKHDHYQVQSTHFFLRHGLLYPKITSGSLHSQNNLEVLILLPTSCTSFLNGQSIISYQRLSVCVFFYKPTLYDNNLSLMYSLSFKHHEYLKLNSLTMTPPLLG